MLPRLPADTEDTKRRASVRFAATVTTARDWTFLSNHGRVLLAIARDPAIRLREIGEQVGITERAAHRIVSELSDAGYITRERRGRRNHYTIRHDLPIPDEVVRSQRVGDLLEALTETGPDGVDPPS
jgi:predicted transcriptional regulator